jgi:guanylate kinase
MATDARGNLLIISGPSGVGKSTICRELVDRLDAFLSVSATTRARRDAEVDGQDYHFMSTEEFERQLAADGFLEHAQVYAGHYYGTPAQPVLEALAAGRTVILEIEIDGTIQVVRRFPDAVSVYILAPDAGEQEERLVGRRQDSPKAIAERLSKAEAEIRRARECGAYRHFVVNETISQTVDEILRLRREDCAT